MKNFVKKNCKHIVTAAALVTMSGAVFGQWQTTGSLLDDASRGGKVGIGTSAPQRLLHLNQNLFVNHEDNCWYQDLVPAIRFTPKDPMGSSEECGPISPVRNWDIEAAYDRMKFLEESNERLTIRSGGNVGIGYTTPNFRLSLGNALNNTKLALYENNGSDVYGLGIASAQFRLHVGSSAARFSFLDAPAGTEIVTIKGDGNVGIGETNPNSKLYVLSADDIVTTNFAQFFANNKTQGIGIGYNSINAIGSNTNQDIIISPKGTGNIGIGTSSSPGSKLSVNGETSIGSSYATTAAPTNGLLVEGNVGVGKSTLTAWTKMDVYGYDQDQVINILNDGAVGTSQYAIKADGDGGSGIYTKGRYGVNVLSNEIGLYVNSAGSRNIMYGAHIMTNHGTLSNTGVSAYVYGGSNFNIALYGISNSSAGSSQKTGLQVEVNGNMGSGDERYAVYGTSDNYTIATEDWYAAFFEGKGVLTDVNGWATSSDQKLKKNIEAYTGNLENLKKVGVFSYNFKNREEGGLGSSDDTYIGFIAQDLEKTFPQFVPHIKSPSRFDSAGNMVREGMSYKGVYYSAMIPVMWGMMKLQQERIEALEAAQSPTATKTEYAGQPQHNANKYYIRQNYPNPWDRETTIQYGLPENIVEALLIVTDLNGNLKLQLKLDKSASEVKIQAFSLAAGIYLYTLVVDGQALESKKMVLTR